MLGIINKDKPTQLLLLLLLPMVLFYFFFFFATITTAMTTTITSLSVSSICKEEKGKYIKLFLQHNQSRIKIIR